ncbi:MAG: hypothetical protein QE263_08275, partial [Vampirovibrionales bacterium]|nr:hypothetical protein [Vampirovibrionales bacterium]
AAKWGYLDSKGQAVPSPPTEKIEEKAGALMSIPLLQRALNGTSNKLTLFFSEHLNDFRAHLTYFDGKEYTGISNFQIPWSNAFKEPVEDRGDFTNGRLGSFIADIANTLYTQDAKEKK